MCMEIKSEFVSNSVDAINSIDYDQNNVIQSFPWLISKFDTNKSTGPNSIPNKIVKDISKAISTPISKICNSSFSSGCFPSILKISKIIPIHKKESKLDVSNYRPISLLSNINKIIEKLMFQRLYSFFIACWLLILCKFFSIYFVKVLA